MNQEMQSPTSEPKLRVGMVSKLTGISTHALRVWEKRYAAVVPARTPAGGRLYSDEDVRRLKLLKRLTDSGHSISGIANLEVDDLVEMASPGPGESLAGGRVMLDEEAGDVCERFISLVEGFEVHEAEQLLARASVAYQPLAFVTRVVVPILHEVGQRWEEGRLRISHEHAVTGIVRGLISSITRMYPPADGSRRAVAVTLSGESHELGALTAALLATMYGWRVLYLGADMPPDEIAHAAEGFGADVILLSVVSVEDEGAREQCATLARNVPDRLRLLIGGAKAPRVAAGRMEVMPDFATLSEILKG